MCKRQRFALVIVSAFVFAFSTGPLQSQDRGTEHKADEQDIFALVIRNQMESWIRGGDKSEAEAKNDSDKRIANSLNFRVFFISIKGKDPSDSFMKRFDDIPRTIRKVSNEEPAKGPHTPVDKTTHRAGIVFSADAIRWHGSDLADVEGGYYCGGRCAAGITFIVQREKGKWVIKDSHLNWIS